METFLYEPRIEPTGDARFAVTKATFGDGYVQAVAQGINAHKQVWPLEFVGTEATITPIKAFLDRHQGHIRFEWTPPLGVVGKYLIESGYKLTALGAGNYRLQVTFEQVFG